MDRYFTIMVVPEREKGVKSFRIPRVIFHAAVFLAVSSLILLSILGYDYWKILREVYENKHLTIENRQLKEQIQLFHMKVNTLTDDLERIHTFEKKLRIITGVDRDKEVERGRGAKSEREARERESERGKGEGKGERGQGRGGRGKGEAKQGEGGRPETSEVQLRNKKDSLPLEETDERLFQTLKSDQLLESNPSYLKLKSLYEHKIASNFGLQAGYSYTKEWSQLTKQSFALAEDYAKFDYHFDKIKHIIKKLEVDVHELDQYLLDEESFLRSMPTLLPARGWITSYYGPRRSHYSGRIKMHEGLDIGAKSGTEIIASADGVVTFSGKKPGFGYFLQINHGYGIETIYAHAKKLLSRKGQMVKRGTVIAEVGSTGYSTGPHLHYEVRVNGTPVDPLYYILD